MGCLEQCYGVCLGLLGKCWGNVEPEVQDGSTLFWDRHSRGEGGEDVRCWGLLAKGVKLRLEEQKLQVEGN